MKTKVIFLLEKEKQFQNQVFAFFPELKEGEHSMLSYAHVGQHSECHINYAITCKKANKKQFADLEKELTNLIGYDLDVLN